MIKLDISKGLIQFYSELKESIIGKKIYHICSDTHFYEKGKFKIDDLTITQYIVGTGGTTLDEKYNNELCQSNVKLDNLNYKIEESHTDYGFLYVYWEGELKFVFIKAEELPELCEA